MVRIPAEMTLSCEGSVVRIPVAVKVVTAAVWADFQLTRPQPHPLSPCQIMEAPHNGLFSILILFYSVFIEYPRNYD